LKWEETATINVGLDYALFNNRFTGSVDLAMKERTSDLLLFIKPVVFGCKR
jgi:iron complex outermembrane receptor protein